MMESKEISNCLHEVLVTLDNYTGTVINIDKQNSNVTGMFLYKKYRCAKCQKIITVLNAVVE